MAFGNVIGLARIEVTPDMSLFAKATSAFAAAGAAAGAVIVAGINEAMGQANITSTLQAQLGTGNKVAADQGKLAGKLYASGVSDTFQTAADAIKATVQSGLAPPGTTNAQLQSIATKATDVSKVFGQDLGDVTNQVSQLIKNGLAKNSDEAFDIITKGFQTGANKAGDFLMVIEEYGTQFRKAGVTGEQAIGLINQGLQAGARDADIVADAVKEFSIRAVDGSKLTSEGFTSLGLNADDMAAKFAKGGKSANAVLDLTLDRLRNVKDPVEQSRIATKLFGTQAEDLGKALFALDPSEATGKLGKFAGTTDTLGKTIRSGPSFEIQLFAKRIKQAFVDVIGNQVLPVIVKFGTWVNTYLAPPLTQLAMTFGSILVPTFTALIKWVSAIVKAFISFGKSVASLGEWLIPIGILIGGFTLAVAANAIAVGTTTAVFSIYAAVIRGWSVVTRIATGVQLAFNLVMHANPIILVITAILALGAAIVIAYRKSETFRNIIDTIWSGMKTGFTAVINAAKTVFNWIKDNWPLLLAILGGPLGLAVLQIVKHWDSIKKGAETAVGAVIDFFKKLPGRITGALGSLGRLLLSAGGDVVSGFLEGLKDKWKTAIGWVTGIKDRVVGAIKSAFGIGSPARSMIPLGLDIIAGLFNGMKTMFLTVGRWLSQRAAAVRSAIGNVTGTLTGRGRDLLNGLLNGAKALYTIISRWVSQRPAAIRSALGNVIGTLAGKGRDLLNGLFNGAKAVYDTVRKWFNGRGAAVRSALGGVADALTGKGRDIINGLWNGLKQKWQDAVDWVKGLKNRVVNAIKSAFGINSPASSMVPLGINIMAGLMKGLLSSRGVLKSAVKGIFSSVTDLFKRGGSLLGGLVGDIGSSIGLGDASVSGSAQQYAQLYMKSLGFGPSQWPALKALWQAESGWNPLAHNASSGAHGIPQSLPASKMSSEGSDYFTNAATQIRWGLKYIRSRYGSPSAAWSFWQRQSPHWYDSGGLARLAGFIPKMTNAPERVLSPRQTALFERMITGRGPAPASSGSTIVIERLVLENHGVIGSKQEVEDWLVSSLTTLKRKGRVT
jgi:phage-related minor tail protein